MIGFVFRLVTRLVSLFVLAALVIFGITMYQIYSFGQRDQARRAPVEVVMGAAEFDGSPSDVLRARLDHAILLFNRGLVAKIITTGGSETGDIYTEAQVAKTYLIDHGVPSADIISDPVGQDTYQSMVSVATAMHVLSLSGAIFVSDRFHEYRVSQIASQLGIVDYSSPTTTSPIVGRALIADYAREAAAVLGAKVLGYKLLSVLRHGS